MEVDLTRDLTWQQFGEDKNEQPQFPWTALKMEEFLHKTSKGKVEVIWTLQQVRVYSVFSSVRGLCRRFYRTKKLSSNNLVDESTRDILGHTILSSAALCGYHFKDNTNSKGGITGSRKK